VRRGVSHRQRARKRLGDEDDLILVAELLFDDVERSA